MEKGKKLYRKIDNKWVTIKGFFYLHDDLTQSLVYPEPVITLYSNVDSKQIKLSHVLFDDDTFDYVHNLYTHLYMAELEYEKERAVNLDDTKLSLLRSISDLPIKDKIYWTNQILNCTNIDLAKSLVEGLKKQIEEYNQTDYDGQHAEEKVLWYDSDLVPNPK